MRVIITLLVSIFLISLMAFSDDDHWSEESSVSEVLFYLGEEKPEHFTEERTPKMIEEGRQLVINGRTSKGSYISKYFVCASCHNSVREDPDLKVIDQDARLNYAKEQGIPYLQSSTFWAIVNRESWYNDDYVKKYGDLVTKANKSLKESIQLCATVCSQGRSLDEYEMNALLAYLWSIELTIKDLDLTDHELRQVYQAYNDQSKFESAKELIKSKYLKKSPATFVDGPEDKAKGYGLAGRPEMGEVIFHQSCQHCHRANGESDVVFADDKTTFRWFKRHIEDNSRLSIYNIIRFGTYSESGHKEYMPHYTLEKMSHQQVEDLRAFIEMKAE